MLKLSEKFFLALIVVTLLLPAALTVWVQCGNPSPQFNWIANRTLSGVTIKKDLPPITTTSWLNGQLQKGLNTLATEDFAGRELLIRAYNQILYRLFDKSYMTSEKIIRGKHGNLFGVDYLAVYGQYLPPSSNEEDETLAVMMKYLSERLKQLGSCFVFVITPSKATLYPEDIPDRYLIKLKQGEQRPTDYQILVPKLKKYGVPYVDGLQITLEHKGTLPKRVFPKTGVHWTRAFAFFTVADLLKTIERESGREMPPLSESIESIDQRPDSTDADLFDLLNLIQKPNQRYLHPRFQVPKSWSGKTGILTSVGGSFTETILDILASAQVFEHMNHYSYFRVYKLRYPGRSVSPVDEHAIPWEQDFWNTTAVVLEANEEAIAGVPSHSIDGFLMAALAELEQKIPRDRSVDDPPRPVVWGFGVHENGIALPKKGFNFPESNLTWISGHDAEIDLPSPRENRDLRLILEASAFLGDGVTERIIKVAVNGIPVGALELVDPDFQFYSLTIKAAANRTPILKLHLSFSPAPGGARPLEIALARLALVPIELPVSQEPREQHLNIMNRE